MGRRLVAATAGVVLIAAAVLAFALGKHPMVAGTNTASPISATVPVEGGKTRCQLVSRVPAGVTHVQLAVSYIYGPPRGVRLKIQDAAGGARFAGGRQIIPGGMVIKLKRPTRALHPARVCTHYFGTGRIVLAGEPKRIPASEATAAGARRNVAAMTFFRPGLSSWAARRDLIADRYANSQAGLFGRWSLWLAICSLVGAAALALWWLVFRIAPEQQGRDRTRSPRRATPPAASE